MTAKSIQDVLAENNCQPLWDRYRNLVSREPISPNSSLHWQWQQMQPLIEQAILETKPEDAERRVLLLTHPGFNGRAATTNNILGGLQVLQPGEIAHAHRHTLGALRFVMQGEGAETSIDGNRCNMARGDLIVTPSWRWHEHINHGAERLVWFDCLDLPLVQHLSTVFFEPAAALTMGSKELSSTEDQFRYPWAFAKQQLNDSEPLVDGTKLFKYPQKWMPTLDCQLLSIPASCQTKSVRMTSSAVFVVAEGEGRSTVGDVTHHWRPNDVISLPHWQWIQHQASSDTILFSVTDEPLLRTLGYLREESRG
jgi:gentisate 1,2-dioxygenase